MHVNTLYKHFGKRGRYQIGLYTIICTETYWTLNVKIN